MNGLHNLVVAGKVLYLVSILHTFLGFTRALLTQAIPGHLGHPSMDRREGEQLRAVHGQDTLHHLPRRVERARSRL